MSPEALLASRGPPGPLPEPSRSLFPSLRVKGSRWGQLFDDLALTWGSQDRPKINKKHVFWHSDFRRLFLTIFITFGPPKVTKNHSKVLPNQPLEKKKRFPDFAHPYNVLEGFWRSRGTKNQWKSEKKKGQEMEAILEHFFITFWAFWDSKNLDF